MKRLIALLVLGSFVAPAYGMGNGESKTRAEVKVHAAAARGADSKRHMDYDFQYEQVGTQEAPKFAERMISVNAHLGVLFDHQLHIANNKAAIIGAGNGIVHDFYGNTIVNICSLLQKWSEIERGAISGDGSTVAVCYRNTQNRHSIALINCDERAIVSEYTLAAGKIVSMALDHTGSRLAVLFEAPIDEGDDNDNARIIVLDRALHELARYAYRGAAHMSRITISPNGKRVLFFNHHETAMLYDVEARTSRELMRRKSESFYSAAFVDDNEFALFSLIQNEKKFHARKFNFSDITRPTHEASYAAPDELVIAPLFVTNDGIYLVKPIQEDRDTVDIYDFDSGAKVHSYPYRENMAGHAFAIRTKFNAGHLAIAHDGTVIQYANGGDKNPDGSLKARCMVYDPLDKADARKARAQRLRYQQAGKFGKAKINAQKAYNNAKELWRTDKKKFALYTAAAVVVVAAGVSVIKRAKKKKLGTRILSALRFSRHGFDTLRYSPRAAMPSQGGQ